jgi:outer membrane receptor protein involved in Fe transport
VLAFSALSHDEVRQTGVGASYNERWKGIGTLSLGVLETDYRRTLEIPGSPGSTERTSQVLPTASFTVDAGRHATAYASYTRGLEGRWAAALQWTSLSSRVVTNDDQIELPPLSTLNVSVRYKLRLFNRPCSARLDVANVTDETGPTISSLYAVFPVLRRNYTLTLATDI